MQNWNQWQLSAGAVATPMPQPPVGYATPGADPMTTMQAYMQYYSQPAPSGYTTEQWQAAQQQNWSQWQQWQQQYQQWQAQYGEKYQETMKHMSAQNMSLATQVSQLPIVQPPPPLPKEEAKPPLPPTTMNTYQFTSMPPPHQNNLPLFPVKQNASATAQISIQNCPQNPPLPPTQPPLPPETSNNSKESTVTGKRGSSSVSESNSAKKLKVEDDELTEAEKTFDAQFKQWEEQFNKWKEQNANHPDKTQYKQYEAKWTSWREKLIERREQMRKKREQQKQAAAKAEVDKNKSLPGDDKIMNILSSTENQGLINNLLGIGKTLGLTTKQNANVPPPPPPPPATETATSTVQTSTMATMATMATTSSQGTSQLSTSRLAGTVNAMPSNAVSSSSWSSQQWAQQYNAGANVPGVSNFQPISGVPPPPFGAPPAQMPPPNFAQPPPNFSNVPNFSQPPPGFAGNDRQNSGSGHPPVPPGMQGRPPSSSYGPNSASGPDGARAPNERPGQAGPINHFDSMNRSNNFGGNEPNRQKDGPPLDRFGRDGITESQQGNQFRPNDLYGQRNDNYKFHDERLPENDQFRREDRNYQDHGNNQFGQQKLNFNNDRFNSGNDRSGPGSNRFGSNDRFGSGNDRFNLGNDRSALANDRFGSGDNRFGNERFGPSTERSGQSGDPAGDRFGGNDRFGPNNEPFGPASDRFNRNNMDRFDQKDIGDRRDSFPNASRGFGRNNQFEPSDKLAPELKKLMEKRRAAMDVFRPSYLDSDKSSNVGSLSESFKKITGDSPFMKNSGINNFGPRGPGPGPGPGPGLGLGLGPGPGSGPGNFRMPMDFKSQGNPDFGPRCHIGHGRNASFDSRDGMPFRGPSPQQAQGTNVQPRTDLANVGTVADIAKDSEELIGGEDHHHPLANPPLDGHNVDSTRKDDSNSYSVPSRIPLLEKTPWTDNQFPEGHPQKEPGTVTGGDDNSSIGFVASEQSTPLQNVTAEIGKVKQDLSTKDNDTKKAEVLPFMGENDPKPEDLNMEPPPEFPNLGPVTTDAIETAEPMRRIDEMHDEREPSSQAFLNNPDCSAPRDNFEPALGTRGMQFRPNTPFFSPRGPGDNRFPMFEPRGAIPFNPVGPNSYSLGPRGPNDGQFGPRGLDIGQFDPRGSNDGHYDPRGPSDAPFRPRGPNDGQFGPRGPNDGPFGPRGSNDGMFGPRGPTDGHFGQRGPNDGPFGPRAAPVDGPFGPRGPGGGQFGPRGSNIGQFGPKYDGQFGQFGQRRPNDGHCGPQGPNSRSFGPGRPNEAPFDNRGPNNAQFASRGPDDGQFKFSGPGDGLSGSRRNEGPYQRSPSGSKGANEGPFPGRFNEKSFDATTDGTSAPQPGNDPFFGPRGPASGPSDLFATRERQFDGRGLDNTGPKNRENSEAIADVRGNGGPFDRKDRMQTDQSMQPGKFDSNDMQGSGWKQQSSYAKADPGDSDTGQRPVQEFRHNEQPVLAESEPFDQSLTNNVERRSPLDAAKPNLPDARADKTMNELTIGESCSGSEYAMFNSANVYAKRSMDSRQSRGRCVPVKEFCIEKQFNYNHGGAPTDKKFIEHIPAKVIEYAHASRTSIQDHLTPVQCFDYGHGNLKPLIPEREVQPKKDFRNWEESEQNLKEYTEKISRYEHYAGPPDNRRTGGDYGHRRSSEEYIDEKRPDRGEYRERENYKARGREERAFDHSLNKDQGGRYDKKTNKERTRERNEQIQKEKSKENKDEDRSKGNINWQENTSKNIVEIKPPDTSVTDAQHNVAEPASKTLELAKTPNCTMVDDLLCAPGRQNRPPKIAIILRGPPGSGKSFVAKLIKDKEVEQGGSAPRILSLDDYFLVEKEIESTDDNGKKVAVKEMVYEYEEGMEQSYVASLVKAFKKNITDGFFNFIILDCINEKISDYEEMWSFAKTKGFKVYVCEMEMDLQICLKRNIHNRTEDEINRIIDYFEPTPSYHQKLDVNSMLQEQAIEEVHMEDSEETQEKVVSQQNEDSQDSQEDAQDGVGVSKWERMEAEDKLDRLDGLAKKKNEGKVQTMKDFLQVPDYYNMEDTSGKKRVRWADLEERKEQEKMRAVGFVVGHTNWDRMMDPTKGGSALTRTKFFSLS